MTHVASVNDVRVSKAPLGFGWGCMGNTKRTTSRAILFDYHGKELWIAKANLLIWAGSYYAKTFAIDSAKAWAEAQRSNNVR